jgi:hypothetical protein
MDILRRAPLRGRRAAAAVFGLFVVFGLVLVFGGSLARSTEIEAEATRLLAETETLKALVTAGEAEIVFYGTDDFVRWQARAHGYGDPGERVILLPQNAPSPEPIVPLGSGGGEAQARTPMDAWLDLLFGA